MTKRAPKCDNGMLDGEPTCSTGPFGRFAWTVRELVSILRREPKSVEKASNSAR